MRSLAALVLLLALSSGAQASEKDTQLFACKMYAMHWDSDFQAYWNNEHNHWYMWGTEQARWEFRHCMSMYGQD